MIYFAHPINTYNSDLERKCLSLIKEKFPNDDIINPSDKEVIDMFDIYKTTYPNNYMQYFANLVWECDKIVILPFSDGMIGAGVWFEAHEHFKQFRNLHMYCVNPFNNSIGEITIDVIDSRKLSIEETRKRIKKEY
jgi:hypothetical protein